MKLRLDHTQRLNLHALMGAQRASVDEVRLWWRLQDMIDLTGEERKAINYHMGRIGEIEQPMWDTNKNVPVREFELSAEDFNKIEKILKDWQPGFVTSGDRRWLEPLLDQFGPAKVNGNAAAETTVHARHRA